MIMNETLRVSIIQSTLDNNLAWDKSSLSLTEMNKSEADRIWAETSDAFRSLQSLPDNKKPHIILLPEFGASREHEYDLQSMAKQTGAIIICGLDFLADGLDVKNEALVVIPFNWPFQKGTSEFQTFYFGKRHPAWPEKQFIESKQDKHGNSYRFKPADTIYILDLIKYGRVGLAICADFYDIERYAMYQGHIQHLFLVAYNQDTESFHHLAQSAARMIFCNVVICNTGHHGGSLAFSPKKQSFERTIYSHLGSRLYTVQTIELPVKSLCDAQAGKNYTMYKSPPPGYPIKKND